MPDARAALLLDAPTYRHFAQFHADTDTQADAAGLYIEEGVRRGDGVVVIVTPPVASRIVGRMRANGLGVGRLQESGQLQILDAAFMLDEFLLHGWPDWTAFRDVIGAALSHVKKNGFPARRVLGDMVNLLWSDDRVRAAVELEGFWNRLRMEMPFALYCTFRQDRFSPRSYGEALVDLARAHAEILFTEQDVQFAAALEELARNVFGIELSYLVNGRPDPGDAEQRLAPPHRMLVWLKRRRPSIAARLLEEVRKRQQPD